MLQGVQAFGHNVVGPVLSRRLVFRCFQTKWVVIVIEPRIDHPQKHKDLPNLGISELPRFGGPLRTAVLRVSACSCKFASADLVRTLEIRFFFFSTTEITEALTIINI